MSRERHHVEPVSLGGINKEANILELKTNIHRKLHKTLDVPYKKFSQYARKKRELFNHKLIKGPDEIERDADIQREYFANLDQLPNRLIQKHVLKMMTMYDFNNKQYEELTGNAYDKPRRKRNKVDQFNELHTMKTNIRKEIAQTFVDIIKNTLYHGATK